MKTSETTKEFIWQSTLSYSQSELFNWHTRRGAFARLNAPWRPVRVLAQADNIAVGSKVTILLPVIPRLLAIKWALKHTGYEPHDSFTDEQISGPFKSWRHLHSFIKEGPETTRLVDRINYSLPRGCSFLEPLLRRELTRLFKYRHSTLEHDMRLHSRFNDRPRKNILIAGSSGFIGTQLRAFLESAGHTVKVLVRRPIKDPYHELWWEPSKEVLDPDALAGIDVVIDLCGANIAAKRWSAARKIELTESRVKPSALLAKTIANLASKPELLINASGVGIYGDMGDLEISDIAPPKGDRFLQRLGREWEGALAPLADTSCRTVILRLGAVLNAAGGALDKMLPVFRAGLGGRLGGGDQFMSWIALQDLLGVFEHTIYTEELSGAINCVAPNPCTNVEFTKTLTRVLGWRHKPIFGVPKILLKVALGELSEVLLDSVRAYPTRLIGSGYGFIHGDIESALKYECGVG